LARLTGTERAAGPPLEKGQTYRFAFAQVAGGEIIGKVLEVPAGGWVKVEVRKADKPTASWVNLALVATVTTGADEK
jgi:hypothetical protein